MARAHGMFKATRVPVGHVKSSVFSWRRRRHFPKALYYAARKLGEISCMENPGKSIVPGTKNIYWVKCSVGAASGSKFNIHRWHKTVKGACAGWLTGVPIIQ